MKKILIIACTLFLALPLFAQENKTNDNKQMICISAFLDPEMDVPAAAKNLLKDRMKKAILKNGISNSEGERFIMTATINELDKETTATAPVMHIVELEVSFYIGDAIEGTLFSQGTVIAKGVDASDSKAYLSAIKNIKVTEPAFKKMIAEAKSQILNYYDSKCDIIIAEALKKAENQEFDIALFELSRVPDVCEDCYKKCLTHSLNIYQQKINHEGTLYLNNARSEWAQGQDINAANKAGSYLVQVDPKSSAYTEALELFNKIEKRVFELDQREWNFKMKQHQDAFDLKMASIQAAKEVGIAMAQSPYYKYYNIDAIYNWWR